MSVQSDPGALRCSLSLNVTFHKSSERTALDCSYGAGPLKPQVIQRAGGRLMLERINLSCGPGGTPPLLVGAEMVSASADVPAVRVAPQVVGAIRPRDVEVKSAAFKSKASSLGGYNAPPGFTRAQDLFVASP